MNDQRAVTRALLAQGWQVIRTCQDSHLLLRAPDGFTARVGLGHRGQCYGGAWRGQIAALRRHGFEWPRAER